MLDPQTPPEERAWLHKDVERISRRGEGGAGEGKPKFVEPVYPIINGKQDQTKKPVATRLTFADGRQEYRDPKTGKPIDPDTIEGMTAKEGSGAKISISSAQRQNLVKGGATNSLKLLSQIRQEFPNETTSSFFGQSAENPLTRSMYGAGRGMQSTKQQQVDATYAGLIDEAIPVFTGGLRGSDAFRRFLIEQVPGPGDKPETVKRKQKIFEQNVQGTNKAFFNHFITDKDMWGPGTTEEEVAEVQGGGKEGGTGGEKPLTDKERQELERLRQKYGR